MRRDIADFVACCLECQRVKAEHQHPMGLLQSHLVPKWKWDIIFMNFIVGLPMSSCHHDSIMVTVDRLTKVAHFSPIKSSYTVATVAWVFLEEVVRLHGIPQRIISDHNPMFTSAFWITFQHDLGT